MTEQKGYNPNDWRVTADHAAALKMKKDADGAALLRSKIRKIEAPAKAEITKIVAETNEKIRDITEPAQARITNIETTTKEKTRKAEEQAREKERKAAHKGDAEWLKFIKEGGDEIEGELYQNYVSTMKRQGFRDDEIKSLDYLKTKGRSKVVAVMDHHSSWERWMQIEMARIKIGCKVRLLAGDDDFDHDLRELRKQGHLNEERIGVVAAISPHGELILSGHGGRGNHLNPFYFELAA